jgi:hypothetical protein
MRGVTAPVLAALVALAVLTGMVAMVAGAGPASAVPAPNRDTGAGPPSAPHSQGAPTVERTHPGRPDPGCQVHIGDVRVAAYRGRGRWIRAADVSAYLACRLRVHRISLQVTLWKAGLLYDHRQAQTTARAAAGRYLDSYLTRVTCKDETTSRFYGVAHAVVYFRGRRGDAWVKSSRKSTPRCGT